MRPDSPKTGAGLPPETPVEVRSGAGAETAFQAMLRKRLMHESNADDKVEVPEVDGTGTGTGK